MSGRFRALEFNDVLLLVELKPFGVLNRLCSVVYNYGTIRSPLGLHRRLAFLGPGALEQESSSSKSSDFEPRTLEPHGGSSSRARFRAPGRVPLRFLFEKPEAPQNESLHLEGRFCDYL